MPSTDARRPAHVLCLLDSLIEIGGAETLALDMAARLDPSRFQRTLVLTRWSDDVAAQEPARSALARMAGAGVDVVGLRRTSRFAIHPWVDLIRFLRLNKVDVIHAHKFGSNLWGTVFGRIARTPVVIAHEHMWSYEGGGMRTIVDRDVIARFADVFIAVSEAGRRQMISGQQIPAEKVMLLPNAIPPLGSGDGDRIRRELGIEPTAPVIGTVANLRPEKALDLLLGAHRLLLDSEHQAHLVIAGEGAERGALERIASDLQISKSVHFIGYRKDVPDLLAAFDVAVCCSDYEGGPLSVMEYMAAGLPIVATNVGGLPELIEHGVTGLLVEARNEHELAAAVQAVIADKELGMRLGSAARDMHRDRFGIDGWVGQIEALYDRLLAAKRSHSSTYPPTIASNE